MKVITNLNKNSIQMSILYFLSFASFALPFAYMQSFLESIGYSVFERGLLLSSCAFVAIFGQFGVGYLCDKYKSDKIFFQGTLIFFVLTSLVLYQLSEQVFFLHLLFVGLVGGLFRVIMNVLDTWCIEIDTVCKHNYGPIRAFGSLGWILGAPLGAILIEHFGYSMLAYVFTGMAVVYFVFTFFMEDAKKESTSSPISLQDMKKLLFTRKYAVTVLMFLIINIIATADLYTVVDKMIALNATQSIIGARFSFQALCELPLFFFGGYLLKRFGGIKLMMFGSLMYVVRFIAYALVQSNELIVLVAALQSVTFPLIMITSKTLVDEATPSYMRASGQSIASSIYIGLPLLLTPIIAGTLASGIGLDMTLIVLGLLGLVPIALGLIYSEL